VNKQQIPAASTPQNSGKSSEARETCVKNRSAIQRQQLGLYKESAKSSLQTIGSPARRPSGNA
jgi:hypothetical protein